MSAGEFDYEQLAPGIRDLVRELRECGWETTDSGDGSAYEMGMDGALPYRHVFIEVNQWTMVMCAERLAFLYPQARVELSWSPG